jgi:hypothetical protein
MTGDLKPPLVLAQRTPSGCPRPAFDIIAIVLVALILFVFLLFAILVGSDIAQHDVNQHHVEIGMNGL